MPDYPKRGRGRRHSGCEMYSACLGIAAVERWGNFNCEGCPELLEFDKARAEDPLGGGSVLVGQQKESSMQDKKPALCEECKTKPVISLGSRLCASCMAIRSNKDRKKIQKAGGRPKGRPKKTPPQSKSSPRPGIKDYMDRMEAKTEPVITVHFDEHKEILEEISRLAGEETRTLELQVIHLLKSSLAATQKGLDRSH